LKGQWIGKTKGNLKGQIIINADDRGTTYGGIAFLLPEDKNIPASAVSFETKDNKKKTTFKAFIAPIDPRTSLPTSWESIKNLFPEVYPSKEATVAIQFEKSKLDFKARTDLGTVVESIIVRTPPTDISDVKGETKAWEEYKAFVSKLAGQNYIFRGQQKPWKLRTAFHRQGRYDLTRFLNVDIPLLYRRLSARTSHVFNLEIPNENGAFLSLVQHHGYPTPLLDWTYSPYVAAFFAFRKVAKTKRNDVVRVYVFDQDRWKHDWNQLVMLNVPFLQLSIIEFLAIENERLIPQQSATTVTNIDDIESYIREKEEIKQCIYLSAIDIPVAERNRAMQELSFMGITASSMFPGLDGACEELRERMF